MSEHDESIQDFQHVSGIWRNYFNCAFKLAVTRYQLQYMGNVKFEFHIQCTFSIQYNMFVETDNFACKVPHIALIVQPIAKEIYRIYLIQYIIVINSLLPCLTSDYVQLKVTVLKTYKWITLQCSKMNVEVIRCCGRK